MARCCAQEHPSDRSQSTQAGAEDEVCGIEEVHVAVAVLGGIKSRLKLIFHEFLLNLDVFGQRLFGALAPPACVAN